MHSLSDLRQRTYPRPLAQSNDCLAVSYAALILQDEGLPVDAAGMEKIVSPPLQRLGFP